METETPPHLSTILLPLEGPMRAHLRNNACPERDLQHYLVAAAITTDIVPTIISHTTATSLLLRRTRKHSMKVCPHVYCILNVYGFSVHLKSCYPVYVGETIHVPGGPFWMIG